MRSVKTLSVVSLTALASTCLVFLSVTASAQKARRTESKTAVSSVAVDQLPQAENQLRVAIHNMGMIDGVVIDTGRRFASGSRPQVMPPGWTCTPRRRSWSCAGPSLSAGSTGYFSWQSKLEVPGQFDLSASARGKPVINVRARPLRQHGISVKHDLRSALDIPSRVSPGSLFMASPMGQAYKDGTWGLEADGKPVEPADPKTAHAVDKLFSDQQQGGGIIKDRLFFILPKPLGERSRPNYRFTYDDPWGDRIVEAPAPTWFYSQPGVTACAPAGLSQCQEMVPVGGTVCVCGCFPDPFATTLTLDGHPIGLPTAVSSSVIRVPLGDSQPGRHVIAWPQLGQSVNFEAVAISGALAQEKLKLGQSTEMMLQLNGTRRQMPLEVKLNSGGVRVQGGNRQLAFFNGGSPNAIHRTVFAVAPGDFSIGYTFDPPSCPCGGWEGGHLLDSKLATHQMSLKGYMEAPLFGASEPTRLQFSSDSLVVRSPRPPFDPDEKIEFWIAQLGLRAISPKYGDLRFEQRSDEPSKATVGNLTLGHGGGLAAGDASLDLHSEFSIPNRADLPLKVGGSYDFNIDDFSLEGMSPALGKFVFSKAPGGSSSIHLHELKSDASGKTLYGDADLKLRGTLRVNF